MPIPETRARPRDQRPAAPRRRAARLARHSRSGRRRSRETPAACGSRHRSGSPRDSRGTGPSPRSARGTARRRSARRAAARSRRRYRRRPCAPRVSARLPATVPSIAQNIAVASAHSGSAAPVSGSVICAAVYCAAGTPSTAGQRVVEIDQPRPGQHALGRDVVEMPAHLRRAPRSRGRSCGAIVAWPPSPVSGTQRRPDGISPETPSPEPGPSTPIGRPATASPPPTAILSPSPRCGRASAWAVKSLITSSRSKAEPRRAARRSKSPGVVGHPTWSPVIGEAIAIAPRRGRGRSPRSREIGLDRLADDRDNRHRPGRCECSSRAVRRDQAETGVGAADIADKPGFRCGLRHRSHLIVPTPADAGRLCAQPKCGGRCELRILVRCTNGDCHQLRQFCTSQEIKFCQRGVDIRRHRTLNCAVRYGSSIDGPTARLLGVSSLNSGRASHGPFFLPAPDSCAASAREADPARRQRRGSPARPRRAARSARPSRRSSRSKPGLRR